MRIVVIGGFGNFGARICRALAPDQSVTVIAVSRQRHTAPADFDLMNIQQAQVAYTHELATPQSPRPLPGISWRCRSVARMYAWAAL